MATPWKNVQSEDDIPELSVRLKPIFGVAPTVYVPVLWAFVLFGVLFLVLVVPGLRHPGSEVTVTSSPAGAGVFVDGTRVGSTPTTVFVAAGNRRIETVLGEDRQVSEQTVRRRLIGSLFAPRRLALHHVHRTGDAASIAASGVRDEAAWALNGEPSAQFQQPPVAHTTARRLWALAPDGTADSDVDGVMAEFRNNLVAHASPAQARDVAAAVLRSARQGSVILPANLEVLVQFFVRSDNEYPAFFRAVRDLVPSESPGGRSLAATGWLSERQDALSTALLAGSLVPDERGMPDRRSAMLGDTRLVQVPAGRYTIGYPLRDEGDTGLPVEFTTAYWIQDREVSRAQFARFVRANPQWAPERREELVASGLADADYLRDWSDGDWVAWAAASPAAPGAAAEPVRSVSWYAASAYVDWLNATTGAADRNRLAPGGRFVLPSAAHWEYAAFLDSLGAPTIVASAPEPQSAAAAAPGALGAYHLAGNLWEWTSDWYARHGNGLPVTTGDQRVVAGGSYATGEARHNLMGAQPPDWDTPFLGFRVALISENDEVRYDGR